MSELATPPAIPRAPVQLHEPPTLATLVATSCGTAIAAVCAIGLFQIERLVGGVWSIAAVATAGACCLLLASALNRLMEIVPSGVGVLAYLSRSFGRPAGFALTIPYFLLTLFLTGAEATIVGVLSARLLTIPVWLGAGVFLIGTWMLCMAGVRLSYRLQTLTTWTLVGTLACLSLSAMIDTAAHGQLVTRLFPPRPTVAHFLAAVGQALFLFMGFELITAQVETATTPRIVARALSTSVCVLTGFYALVSLGFSCLPTARLHAETTFVVPQLALAEQTGGALVLLLVVVLSTLASFTSFNGALLSLSRFLYALATQGVLPRMFAQIDRQTLVPRLALTALLLLAVAATTTVLVTATLQPLIFAAAVAAAVAYAAAVWAREYSPFVEPHRLRSRRLLSGGVALAFLAFALGVLVDAGAALPATLLLLVLVYGVALGGAAQHARHRPRGPAHMLSPHGGPHAD